MEPIGETPPHAPDDSSSKIGKTLTSRRKDRAAAICERILTEHNNFHYKDLKHDFDVFCQPLGPILEELGIDPELQMKLKTTADKLQTIYNGLQIDRKPSGRPPLHKNPPQAILNPQKDSNIHVKQFELYLQIKNTKISHLSRYNLIIGIIHLCNLRKSPELKSVNEKIEKLLSGYITALASEGTHFNTDKIQKEADSLFRDYKNKKYTQRIAATLCKASLGVNPQHSALLRLIELKYIKDSLNERQIEFYIDKLLSFSGVERDEKDTPDSIIEKAWTLLTKLF